jgi:hypothetical protein
MPKYLRTMAYILLLFFAFIILNEFVYNKKFDSEPFLLKGYVPYELEKIEKVDAFPNKAKALIEYKEKTLFIHLPKNADYKSKIIDDINLLELRISKLEKTLIPYYIMIDEGLETPDFVIYKNKFNIFIYLLSFMLFGAILELFSAKNYFLIKFKYHKQNFNKIVSIVIFFSIMYFINFFNIIYIEKYNNLILFALSSILLINCFENKIFKYSLSIVLSMIPVFMSLNDLMIFLIISIIINIIINSIKLKKLTFIKSTGEVNANGFEQRSDNDESQE